MSFSYYTRWLSPTFRRQLAWLRELKPLPKVHYSWALPDSVLAQPDERVYEYVRISRAACVQAEYATQAQIETCVRLCHPVGATIGLNLKPYHNIFDAKRPPTANGDAERDLLHNSLVSCKGWLVRANERQSAATQVTAIMLDSEVFYVKADNPAWNQAITDQYDAVYDLCKEVFPDARVEWYERGIEASQNETGWSATAWNTFDNKADSFSCDVYRVPEITEMRETFRRTYDMAISIPDHPQPREVTPWIGLGAGYQRDFDFQHWVENWDYPTIYTWMLGAEINNAWYGDRPKRYAPWNAAKVCVFYPPPFDPRSPAWVKHFVAYCRGAQGMKILP